jgi:hypothetical protein
MLYDMVVVMHFTEFKISLDVSWGRRCLGAKKYFIKNN